MRLDSFAIHSFAPFAAQICEFGERRLGVDPGDVHILVGENGTGKTRLLSMFMAALGNHHELDVRVSTAPLQALVVGRMTETQRFAWITDGTVRELTKSGLDLISAKFTTGGVTALSQLSRTGANSLNPYMGDSIGLAFRAVAALNDEKLAPMAAVANVQRTQYLVLSSDVKGNIALTQSLANMKIRAGMYLAGAPDGKPDRTVRMTTRLEQTLSRVTKRQFIFIVQQVGSEIRLKVNWGGVLMDLKQLPDGLRSIIGWLASCVVRLDSLLPASENPLDTPVILMLDEPETHLHPAWQREVLPALQAMLPQAQIIVATHSPFIVSSVNYGWIYVLKADRGGIVTIQPPRPCSPGDTYIDALEDVLGVKEWYDPETEDLLSQFRAARDTALQDFTEPHKEAMRNLAVRIATRSESLQSMMGRELAQFESRERSVIKVKGG